MLIAKKYPSSNVLTSCTRVLEISGNAGNVIDLKSRQSNIIFGRLRNQARELIPG